MADWADSKLPQIVYGELWQYIEIDRILRERGCILPQTQALEPSRGVQASLSLDATSIVK